MNKSQANIVESHIRKTGFVARNWCIQKYITRLSSIIFNLKEKGYEFETKTVGKTSTTIGDFHYIATEMPDKAVYEKEEKWEVKIL